MTNRDMASQENTDLWLEQQLAEAHALLGDTQKKSEPANGLEEALAEEPCIPDRPAEEPMDTRAKASRPVGNAPRKKDKTSAVLLCVIAVELIAIAGIAFFWVSVLT